MAVRERTCPQCGSHFQYEISRGTDRLYCSFRCKAYGRKVKLIEGCKGKTCKVLNCEKEPRSPGGSICEMHYARLRRNGTLDKIGASPLLKHSGGYVRVYAPGHPMATGGESYAYQHRVVFYDAHGDGPFNCHVCGRANMLANLHVDHLNEVRDDNRLENLRPACPRCNQWRGKTRRDVSWRVRHVHWLEHEGERLPISEWARRLGIRPGSILWRMRNGWPLSRALTERRGVRGPQQLPDSGGRPGEALILGAVGARCRMGAHAENFSRPPIPPRIGPSRAST